MGLVSVVLKGKRNYAEFLVGNLYYSVHFKDEVEDDYYDSLEKQEALICTSSCQIGLSALELLNFGPY
jgi:hypothetical protein